MSRAGWAFLLLPSAASAALAHAGESHDPSPSLSTWEFEPLIVVILLASALIYSLGLWNVWRSAGGGHGIRVREAVYYALGWLALAIALVSPVHTLGQVLFSMHMTQHELLMLVAAPLMIRGRPFVAGAWAMPSTIKQPIVGAIHSPVITRSWSFISNGMVAAMLHAAALWVWHIPAMFQATLHSDVIHTLQHASFFLTALLFWWAVLYGTRGVQNYGAGVLYLFATMVQSGLLGIFLTLTTHVWYPIYNATAAAYGLTAVEDQQIGGLIMWIPAGAVYMLAALMMFSEWLRESDRRVRSREAQTKARVAVTS